MAQQIFDDKKFTGCRLSTDIVPKHYELFLEPNFKDFTFIGKVKITLAFGSQYIPRSEVVLHVNEVVINDGHLIDVNNASQGNLKKVTYSKETETATLEFDSLIEPTRSVITLDFKGILNDKMKGFYRTAFKISDTQVYAATTQFEATDARRCFPCWDEPAMKAVFSVTLAYADKLVVGDTTYPVIGLSNTNEVSTKTRADGLLEVTFEDTPIMSTYLLAFIIGPFEKLAGSDGRRPVNVYTTPGKAQHGEFALQVAIKSLPYYEDYFKIPYPLPKMDLVAIPDFVSGAMENWGLVTYREMCLLFDPNSTSTDRKQYIAIVVAHELAHQWFGNLVTMEWWTHLWLNEGFASFMEYLCVDHIFPEYDIWSQFTTDCYGAAMSLDSLHNSHPIEVPVKHPSEIDEIFDSISYNKGASVIRMLYNYIGDQAFRVGMKNYLEKFAYKNASTEDLWEALEAASDKPVGKIMSGWTSQKGYPWLSASVELKDGDAHVSFNQSKFTADGKLLAEDKDTRWMVPISAITGSNPTKTIDLTLLSDESGVGIIKNVGDQWIKLNPGSVGLYRTAYSDEMSKKLYTAISNKSLPATDRVQVQNDLFALCKAAKVSTVDYLKLLDSYRGETNFSVWCSIDSCLGALSTLLHHTNFQSKFHSFGRKLYQDLFAKLTWDAQGDETHIDSLTRLLMINRLVSFEDEAIIKESQVRYQLHLSGTQQIPADIRGAVYRSVSIHGSDEAFDNLFEIYRSTEVHEEKNRIAKALGSTSNPARLERVIKFGLSDEVRLQDKVFVFIPLSNCSPTVAWRVFKENKDFFKKAYGSNHIMNDIVKCVTRNFASEEMAQEITKFFDENKFPGTERTVQQSVETIRLSCDWLKRDAKSIELFLSE